jgi:hypothetical protein
MLSSAHCDHERLLGRAFAAGSMVVFKQSVETTGVAVA